MVPRALPGNKHMSGTKPGKLLVFRDRKVQFPNADARVKATPAHIVRAEQWLLCGKRPGHLGWGGKAA